MLLRRAGKRKSAVDLFAYSHRSKNQLSIGPRVRSLIFPPNGKEMFGCLFDVNKQWLPKDTKLPFGSDKRTVA